MVAFVALMLGQDPNPCLLIEHRYGAVVPWEERNGMVFAPRAIEVALWPDGRLVWRGAEKEMPGLARRRYFEAKIPISRVKATMTRLANSGVFARGFDFGVPFDSRYTIVTAEWKNQSITWTYGRTPTRTGLGPKGADAVAAWKLVMREAKALIPAKGKPIPPLKGERAWYSTPSKATSKG